MFVDPTRRTAPYSPNPCREPDRSSASSLGAEELPRAEESTFATLTFRAIESSSTYLSWKEYIAGLGNAPTSPLTEGSQATARALGSAFLLFLLREAEGPQLRSALRGENPLAIDALLHESLRTLQPQTVERFISLRATRHPGARAQATSILRLHIAHWCQELGFPTAGIFPAERPHFLEEVFAKSELAREAHARILGAVARDGSPIKEEVKGNYRRILHRFLTFVIERKLNVPLNDAAAEAQDPLLPQKLDEIVRSSLPELVQEYISSPSSATGGELSRGAVNSIRSTLRHFLFPLVPGATLPGATRPTVEPLPKVEPPHSPAGETAESRPVAPQRAANTPDVALAVSTARAERRTTRAKSPIETPAPAKPQVSSEEFGAAREKLLTSLHKVLGKERPHLAKLSVNDVRVFGDTVMILRDRLGIVPGQSAALRVADKELAREVASYLAARRGVLHGRLCAHFFVDERGEALPTAPNVKKKTKR